MLLLNLTKMTLKLAMNHAGKSKKSEGNDFRASLFYTPVGEGLILICVGHSYLIQPLLVQRKILVVDWC